MSIKYIYLTIANKHFIIIKILSLLIISYLTIILKQKFSNNLISKHIN